MVLLEPVRPEYRLSPTTPRISNGRFGDAALYIDMAAPGALVSKIQEVASQPEVLRRFSVLGKTRAENCYSWNVLIPRYLKMYESVLSAWRLMSQERHRSTICLCGLLRDCVGISVATPQGSANPCVPPGSGMLLCRGLSSKKLGAYR